MKKIILIFVIITGILSLMSCSEDKVETLKNPQEDLFSIIGVFKSGNDEFFILRRIDVGFEGYTMQGYIVGSDGDPCTLGAFHKRNYMIKYNDEYYDIVEANKLGLYTCDMLIEAGVIEERVYSDKKFE